mgnify:CR=1 FL=1
MKKTILTLVCAIAALSVSAQRASSSSSSFFSTEKADNPVTFSIRGGVNFSNLSVEGEGLDSRTGFHGGVNVDIPLLQSLYLSTGLYYTTKGYGKVHEEGEYMVENKVEHKASANYLEIPVLASYRYDFSDNAQLQVNVGPYFAYGIGGKIKYTENEYYRSLGSWAINEERESDYFDDDTNKFDVGLQIGAGMTFAKHIYLGVAYEFGFVNVIDDVKSKNSNFMVSLGYQF